MADMMWKRIRTTFLTKIDLSIQPLINAHGASVWFGAVIGERSDGCVFLTPVMFDKVTNANIDLVYRVFQKAIADLDDFLTDPYDEESIGMFDVDPLIDPMTLQVRSPDTTKEPRVM